MKISYPLTVFYDGACGVCSSEMRYYQSIADHKVNFVDISTENFIAESYGKSDRDFQKELHLCDSSGVFFTGVEAFRKLWQALPSPFYPLLSGVVGLPGVNLAVRSGYAVFARFRHLLPAGTKNVCTLPKHR